eukprot:66366_1
MAQEQKEPKQKGQDRFKLPALPWAEDALAKKGISQETIQYHYGKHHAGYVRKLNAQDKDGKVAADATLESLIKTAEGKIFNLAAQIYNHSFYWESMTADGGECKADLNVAKQLKSDFGGVDKFIEAFKARAGGHFGSGWVWLSVNKQSQLVITDGHDAFNPLRNGLVPILTIDVWEHAYYVDQRNNRGQYIDSFIGLINWERVEQRYVNAIKQLKSKL